jgi:hypothetical protein
MKIYKTFTALGLSLMTILLLNGFDKQTTNSRTKTLTSLKLESNTSSLNVGETAELTVMGTYSDGSTKEVETGIEYITTPRHSVYISGNTMTVLKDGAITVQAKSNSIDSNTIALDVTWTVNGHTLPPEPDKTLNDSTLLGIDTNDNGVRDDVERYILQTYGKEEITIQIGFQVSRAYDVVIEHPEDAWETDKALSAAQDCESYFSIFAEFLGDPLLLDESNDMVTSKRFKSIQLNTRERIRNFLLYNQMLSGGVFTATPIDERKAKCSFDANMLLKARK